MTYKLRWLGRFYAIFALVLLCASPALASVEFHVGQFDLNEDPVPFSASWLHDASSTPSAGTSSPGASTDNRAYRMGDTSSPLVGSFFGDYNQAANQVTNIRGTLSGNSTNLLLDNFDSSKNYQKFILKLGQEAGAGKGGKLAFETNGAGSGQYTGGYVDYVLAVDTDPDVNVDSFTNVLSGTLFFKPQGENSSSMLSPNRGTVSQFTLWGYNYMHDSFAYDGSSVDWDAFMASLGGYSGSVERPDIVAAGARVNQTLGISLYVTSTQGHMPEPTAFIVWGMLMMVGASLTGRNR